MKNALLPDVSCVSIGSTLNLLHKAPCCSTEVNGSIKKVSSVYDNNELLQFTITILQSHCFDIHK